MHLKDSEHWTRQFLEQSESPVIARQDLRGCWSSGPRPWPPQRTRRSAPSRLSTTRSIHRECLSIRSNTAALQFRLVPGAARTPSPTPLPRRGGGDRVHRLALPPALGERQGEGVRTPPEQVNDRARQYNATTRAHHAGGPQVVRVQPSDLDQVLDRCGPFACMHRSGNPPILAFRQADEPRNPAQNCFSSRSM